MAALNFSSPLIAMSNRPCQFLIFSSYFCFLFLAVLGLAAVLGLLVAERGLGVQASVVVARGLGSCASLL